MPGNPPTPRESGAACVRQSAPTGPDARGSRGLHTHPISTPRSDAGFHPARDRGTTPPVRPAWLLRLNRARRTERGCPAIPCPRAIAQSGPRRASAALRLPSSPRLPPSWLLVRFGHGSAHFILDAVICATPGPSHPSTCRNRVRKGAVLPACHFGLRRLPVETQLRGWPERLP
jgi:hypothetical protein